MLKFTLFEIIFDVILIFLIIFLRKHKKKGYTYIVFFTIFYIYLMNVLKYTLFPIPTSSTMIENFRASNFTNINLIPFSDNLISKEKILNIILSMPFGFGILFIAKLNKKQVFLSALLFGVTIEGLQLLLGTMLKFMYRTVDIDDVIMNFLGVILGYILFKLVSYIYIKVVQNSHENLNPFFKYIYDVSNKN